MDSKMLVLIVLIIAFILLICCFLYLSYSKKQQKKYEERLIRELKKNKETNNSVNNEVKVNKNQFDLDSMLERMQKDLEGQKKDKVANFEQEQEDSSIISYKELKKATQEFDDSEEKAQEESPISVKDVLAIRREEIEKNEDPILSMLDAKSEKKENVSTKKFHSTDFISPIYGKEKSNITYQTIPAYEEQEEILSVLNDDDTEESEKFLNELKDFRNQL